MSTPRDRPARPYGSWPSPITVDMVVAGSVELREVWADGDDLYWIEGRPAEGGRQVIVRRAPDGSIADVTPQGFNARTMVHEYGGGAYVVDRGLVVFSNLDDGRLYRHGLAQPPQPLTGETGCRYADLRVDRSRDRVLCVVEDHRRGGEPVNVLSAVGLRDGASRVLVEGADFYSHPRLDPDGRRLAWLSWSHPDMPWDATELWVGDLTAEGDLRRPARVAGGPGESIAQPEWAPDGTLVFCSDRTGWSNLYRWNGESDPRPLAPIEAEFADPQWVFGQSAFGIAPDGTIVAAARSEGRDRLYLLTGSDGPPERIDQPYRELGSVRAGPRRVAFIGMGPRTPASVVLLDRASGATSVVRRASELTVDPAYLSEPQAITYPTAGRLEAHALFYPPANPAVRAPDGELPPLLVLSHGGPTAHATADLDLETRFFTSRGFAVVDVDYGGSTGYGREYRSRLDGRWGIVDVEDCTNAARHLADRGLADRARLLIRGGSAGGYTTLQALTHTDVFAAGASHYGVGDLEALARDTHKFESRYLDRLVGPYPEALETYRERSPIRHTDLFSRPLIVLQGRDDRVVPPEQAEQIVDALERKRIPYAYLVFEGEGHGFRRAETIARALEAELSFYAQLFGFELADAVEPVPIRHLNA